MPALKNSKHEAFCRNIAHHQMTISKAYAKAGYKPSRPNSVRLSKQPDIIARIAELQAALAEKSGWTAEKRLKTLQEIAERTERKDPRVALGAIAEANKMQGSYPPSKLQHSGPNGGPIPHVDLSKVNDEDLDKLEAILGPLAGAAGDDADPDPGGEGAPTG